MTQNNMRDISMLSAQDLSDNSGSCSEGKRSWVLLLLRTGFVLSAFSAISCALGKRTSLFKTQISAGLKITFFLVFYVAVGCFGQRLGRKSLLFCNAAAALLDIFLLLGAQITLLRCYLIACVAVAMSVQLILQFCAPRFALSTRILWLWAPMCLAIEVGALLRFSRSGEVLHAHELPAPLLCLAWATWWITFLHPTSNTNADFRRACLALPGDALAFAGSAAKIAFAEFVPSLGFSDVAPQKQ